jgi:hypothetical protein
MPVSSMNPMLNCHSGFDIAKELVYSKHGKLSLKPSNTIPYFFIPASFPPFCDPRHSKHDTRPTDALIDRLHMYSSQTIFKIPTRSSLAKLWHQMFELIASVN